MTKNIKGIFYQTRSVFYLVRILEKNILKYCLMRRNKIKMYCCIWFNVRGFLCNLIYPLKSNESMYSLYYIIIYLELRFVFTEKRVIKKNILSRVMILSLIYKYKVTLIAYFLFHLFKEKTSVYRFISCLLWLSSIIRKE